MSINASAVPAGGTVSESQSRGARGSRRRRAPSFSIDVGSVKVCAGGGGVVVVQLLPKSPGEECERSRRREWAVAKGPRRSLRLVFPR